MKSETRAAPAACSHAAEAAAWAVGGLDAAGRAAFEAHREHCASCAAEAARFRPLVQRLRDQPAAEPAADLTARILAALPSEPTAQPVLMRRLFWRLARAPRWMAAAAALLVVTLGAWAVANRPAGSQAALQAGCAWLAERQGADGSWDPVAAGGSALYRPALTALATLALTREPAHYASQIAAGCAALARQQQEDGGIGPEHDGRMYNHALAVWALLVVHGAGGHAELQPVITRALAFTRARQQASGGWGYRDPVDGEAANTAVTAWQLQILARAGAQGWPEAGGNLRRGLIWLQRQADGSGRFGYVGGGHADHGSSATLDAMGAYTLLRAGGGYPQLAPVAASALNRLRAETPPQAAAGDFYRAFFTTAAWDAGGERSLAQLVRAALCDRRETRGTEKGSWTPSDAWGTVGGRLYATSLAVLTLQPQRGIRAM